MKEGLARALRRNHDLRCVGRFLRRDFRERHSSRVLIKPRPPASEQSRVKNEERWAVFPPPVRHGLVSGQRAPQHRLAPR